MRTVAETPQRRNSTAKRTKGRDGRDKDQRSSHVSCRFLFLFFWSNYLCSMFRVAPQSSRFLGCFFPYRLSVKFRLALPSLALAFQGSPPTTNRLFCPWFLAPLGLTLLLLVFRMFLGTGQMTITDIPAQPAPFTLASQPRSGLGPSRACRALSSQFWSLRDFRGKATH